MMRRYYTATNLRNSILLIGVIGIGFIVAWALNPVPPAKAESPKRHVGVIKTDAKIGRYGGVYYTRDREANLCALIVDTGDYRGGISTTLFDCKLLDPK